MKIPKRDPEKEQFVDMLLCMNYMEKYGYLASQSSIYDSKRMIRGFGQSETTWLPSKYDQLGSRRKLLSEFLTKRQKGKEELRELKKQRRKEKEDLRELKKQRRKEKEELRELKKQKREVKKIKREKKELKKMKREKKKLRKMKREMKELKRKKRAETRLNDEDEAPSTKKLKLAEVGDDRANDKEMVNLEAVFSEDVEQQRQWFRCLNISIVYVVRSLQPSLLKPVMKIPKRDPEKEQFVDMLLCMNYMEKYGYLASQSSIYDSKRMIRGFGQTKTTWLPSKYDQLGSRRKLLSEFLSKRQKEKEELLELKKQRQKEKEELLELKKQRQKEKEELRELKKQRQKENEELRELKKQKRELKKIKQEKKELKKIKREKKELRRMKREKKELKKKKRAETTVNDGDEAPSKKLKLVEVRDNHANEKEMLNLEAVSSEDVDQQRQCVPPCEPVGNLIAEGLKLCTRQAEKKNEIVDHSKDE